MPALPAVATAFAAGTFAGAILGGAWWMAALVAAMAFMATALWSRAHISVLVLLAAIAFAAAGHARFDAANDQPPSPLATLDGPHEVTGTIRDDPHIRGTYATAEVDVDHVDGEPVEGGIRLTMPAPSTPLEAGDRLAFTADIERPPEIEEFDYAAYLRTQGIDAVAAFPDRWDIVGHDDGWWLTARLRDIRGWSIANIERTLPEPESSLAVGLLLGAQRTMPDDLEQDLRQTGTTHLVVVSGQNIALLIGSVVPLLAAVMSRRKAAVLAAVLLLPAYVVLVGAEPPVVRAAIMAVGLTIASVSGRRTPGWVFLTYAAAGMLAWDPLLATSVSFRLSLAATAGVILLAPPLSEAVMDRLGLTDGGFTAALIEIATVSIAASLMVFPVQTATFGTLPLLQIPANIAVAPFYQATLLASLIAVLVGAVEPLRDISSEALRLMPAAFIGIVRAFARIPATVEVSTSLPAGIVWYAVLGIGLWLLHRRRSLALSPSGSSGVVWTLALAVGAGGLWLAALAPAERLASVTVLDVGQGLAVLVRDRGNAVLVDAGPPDGAVIAALSRVGQRLELDAIVLTHDDSDHTGGLAQPPAALQGQRRARRTGITHRRRAGVRHWRSHSRQRPHDHRGALAAPRHSRGQGRRPATISRSCFS